VQSRAMFASVAFFPAPAISTSTPARLRVQRRRVQSRRHVRQHHAAAHADCRNTATPVPVRQYDAARSTPTIAALRDPTATRHRAGPDGWRVTYVVLLTDGPRARSDHADGGVVESKAARATTSRPSRRRRKPTPSGIKTYVFGIGSIADLDRVATAGGTALVTIGDTAQLLAALSALPKPAFSLPNPSPLRPRPQ